MGTLQKQCFQCDCVNTRDQDFCGACGAPLTLAQYVAVQVDKQIAVRTREKDLFELESSVAIFERAWSWVKIVGGVVGVVLLIGGATIAWRAHDLTSALEGAKDLVAKTAQKTSDDIALKSATSLTQINTAAMKSTAASQSATQISKQQTEAISALATDTRNQLANETQVVHNEVETAHGQIKAATQLQPEMETIQKQLKAATSQLQDQQVVLSSSENFVKHVFSSHETFFLDWSPAQQNLYVVVPPQADGIKSTVLYALLPSAPIQGTLQLQTRIFVQPPNSYSVFHNLLIFFWNDPPDSLKHDPLIVTYFPDTSDREHANSLKLVSGRVYADDQALPKFGVADLEYKGSKWFQIEEFPNGRSIGLRH